MGSWIALPAVLVAVAAVVVLLWRAGGGETADPGPVHVHGLGVNPADGALFIATHTGLYRLAPDAEKAERVGESYQDTMGFTVVGPDRFLGSGHPDVRDDLPPLLGLIESTDAGETWEPVSLLGEADFHVLRSAGDRVYGYDASNDRLLVSADHGRAWSELRKPGLILDLAVDPEDSGRLVIVSSEGLFESRNGGETWDRVGDEVGLLAWPSPGQLYVVNGEGQVFRSTSGGRELDERGAIGGEPAALLFAGAQGLFAALHDGTITHSKDGGATWVVRSTP
ncbi:MAG TPA: sialidase family protein [Gaiellaceae bacterium]|nr:sialidase family protein [Gaiellaceae bacterium]